MQQSLRQEEQELSDLIGQDLNIIPALQLENLDSLVDMIPALSVLTFDLVSPITIQIITAEYMR